MAGRTLQAQGGGVKTARCTGCGKQIIVATDTDGKTQVLDPTPPVYGHIGDAPDGTPRVRRILGGWVSHVATCAHANEFHTKRTRPAAIAAPYGPEDVPDKRGA